MERFSFERARRQNVKVQAEAKRPGGVKTRAIVARGGYANQLARFLDTKTICAIIC